jgi:hypothetical protein
MIDLDAPQEVDLRRSGTVHIHDASLNVWEEHCTKETEVGMTRVMVRVLQAFRDRGFATRRDPDCVKNFPTIAEFHWVGIRNGLEFAVRLHGRHLSVEFFQNVANVENPNGGRYDSRRFSRMPRTMQLRCIVEMGSLMQDLIEIGYIALRRDKCPFKDPSVPTLLQLRDLITNKRSDDPLEEFNTTWRHDRFERDSTGFPSERELRSWDNRDADSIVIRTGEPRYLRVRGRLMRGICYPNMGMWQFRYGGEVTNAQAGLFINCARPDLGPRRLVPNQPARLKAELQAAIKREDYRRVAKLATVLGRTAGSVP